MRRVGGSFGSRNGAAWSPAWATDRRRAESGALAHGTASLQETVTSPSQEALRRAIESNTCPFCGAGPYKSLGAHSHKAHGVSAAELREMSGLKTICSDELSAGSRERLERRPDRDEISSRGGLASPIGRGQVVGSWREGYEASLAKRLAVIAERDPVIVERAMAGDRLVDIAADLGVSVMLVQRALKRNGTVAGKQQVNAERRARLAENREKARLATEQRLAAEWALRSSRWTELGGDWEALCRGADEEGVSRKSMRAYFAKHGVVLDGRRKSP